MGPYIASLSWIGVFLQAAMTEVDSDGSGTMDFYEYLQVAMLVERKKGETTLE